MKSNAPQHSDPDLHYTPMEVDKTFVEGNQAQPAFPQLQSGTRINASSLSSVNPYAKSGGMQARTGQPFADVLPDGNQPIPLGSGIIVGLLGSGGMAKVYKIWNEKLEVFRAVKILLPAQQASLKGRFETEAKITAKLHHPNIVEIYNVGEWNGLPCLEMEYIDGVTLETLIAANGKLPDVVCSAIAILIARALDYAHCQEFLIYGKNYHGVIHRDLKPANIMISKTGDVRLMDFGIARPTEASLHTVEGSIVGTMQYLSPEQMDGIGVDARSDIYSFGAILYEMLTGTKTFPQTTITDLMKKKIKNDYRKFSEFDFHVSIQAAHITQKCLQINKNDRFRNVSAMLVKLEAAHKSISREAPEKVLRQFCNNPVGFKDSGLSGVNIRIPPKVIIPLSGILAIGILVTIFIVTDPYIEPSVASKTGKNTAASPTLPAESLTVISPLVSVPPSLRPKPDNSLITKGTDRRRSGGNGTVKPKSVKRWPQRPGMPSADVTVATPPSDIPNVPAIPEKCSSIDELRKKYGNDDLVMIGKQALRSRNSDDAIVALKNVSATHPDARIKNLLLFDAYLKSGKLVDAQAIATGEPIADAEFDYLCGRLHEKRNNVKKALECYQAALTKPSSVRSRNEIRNDALYHTAVIRGAQHRTHPTPDTRIQALNAWNTVKRTYMATPAHSRFKKANSELASIP